MPKQGKESAAEVVGMRVGISKLVGDGAQKEVTGYINRVSFSASWPM